MNDNNEKLKAIKLATKIAIAAFEIANEASKIYGGPVLNEKALAIMDLHLELAKELEKDDPDFQTIKDLYSRMELTAGRNSKVFESGGFVPKV